MSTSTGISWTDATWNPVRGCSRVSEGCRNCYAERVAARFSGPRQPYEGLARIKTTIANNEERDPGNKRSARWTGIVRLILEHLADPLRWKKPRRVFVNSMSDLFHESLTNEQIAAVFGVMAAAPQHTFQVLTKRARRMREWFEWLDEQIEKSAEDLSGADCAVSIHMARDWARLSFVLDAARELLDEKAATALERVAADEELAWPLPNVWLGVSVENQEAANERIPELLRTPAAVRFLSCEPLIGPVDLGIALRTVRNGENTSNVDWVIAGCESGPGARECKVEWLRSLRDQCAAAGVPFFLKQAVEQFPERDEDPRVVGYSNMPPPVAEVIMGYGSKRKAGGVIELPYLDGVQHAAFPEVAP